MDQSPSLFRRITVAGTGLIGGSLGLALKRCGYGGRITGCDRPQILERALDTGAIDEAEPDFAAAVRNADLVILAAPVGAVLEQFGQIKLSAPAHALITDTGSTKRAIVERARAALGNNPLFIGGHPLAGKEKSSIEFAESRLFESTRYVLTPLEPEHLQDGRVHAFRALIESVGAQTFVTDAETHDRALAYLSHLPQLLSTALAGTIAAEGPLPLELAAAGFRDMTRLAESSYGVWRDVCLTNADHLRLAIESMIRKLEVIKAQLEEPALEQQFEAAREIRERWRKL